MKTTTRSRTPMSAPEPLLPSAPNGSAKLSPFAIIVLVIVLGTAAILALNNVLHKPASQVNTQSVAGSSDSDVTQLIAAVGRHIVVNNTEQPTIATIQDAPLLRTQNPTFYKDAQNGDRLIIWSDKAVLYSPAKDILLAVLPVSLPVPAAEQATSSAPLSAATSTQSAAEHATIDVRNGSGIPGLGRSTGDKLKAAGLTVLPATEAQSKTYVETLIIKVTDKPLPSTLQTLLSVTHGSLGALPVGEAFPKGDFVVIVGSAAQK